MRQGTLIGSIIIAIGIVVGAVAFAVVGALLEVADGQSELRIERLEDELAEMRDELDEAIAQLRDVEGDLRQMTTDFARLTAELAAQAARAPVAVPRDRAAVERGVPAALFEDELVTSADNMTEELLIARDRYNVDIGQPNNGVMLDVLGHPGPALNPNTCQSITNPDLRAILETRNVGPFTVTMIAPAIASLDRIMRRLEEDEPQIYAALGTAGTVCARNVRGSTTSISNHSWGTAIDVTLEGVLDDFGDGGTQFGLLIVAEYFNDEGWYWGAGYRSREDSMHFEVGIDALRRWQSEGLLER
ncbi:MAG: M15 family metallopeptidase [Pseudomonadota bacterium]